MKLLELGKYYPPHRGGIETLLRSFCEGFSARGAEVTCIVSNRSRKQEVANSGGILLKRLPTWGEFFSTPITPAYLKESRNWSGDLLHAHFPNPLADLSVLRAPPQLPIVLSYHSDVVRQAGWMRLYGSVLSHVLERVNQIVVASPPQLEHSKWLKPVRDRCSIIPYGIDLRQFDLTAEQQAKVFHLRQNARLPVVLTVGRFVGYKGHSYLIEAIKNLEAELWLLGSGPLEPQLKAQVARLELRDRVKFLGNLANEELSIHLHACTLFVLPSITPNEAFGIVQLEAMACGKPVISCDLKSGVPFVNLHDQTGIVVPPSSARALAEAIKYLLDRPDIAGRYAANGKARVEQEFRLEQMIERYWELFQKMGVVR
ncbi:MAG: glycosyltransferase [Verrucomicrobiota bacterium]|nr:glycosyltransferase [Verrucomicrobiota bacterium]